MKLIWLIIVSAFLVLFYASSAGFTASSISLQDSLSGNKSSDSNNDYVLGKYYSAMASYDLALKYLLRYSEFVKKNNRSQLPIVYQDIGGIFRKLGDYEKFLEFNERVLLIGRYLPDSIVMQSYINIGIANFHRGQIEDAIVFLNKARKLIEERGYYEMQPLCLLGIGMTQMKRGQKSKAFETFTNSLNAAKKHSCYEVSAQSLLYLVQLSLAENDMENAEKLLREAEALVIKYSLKDQFLPICEHQIIIAEKKGDLGKRAHWQRKLIDHSDSIFNDRLVSKIAAIQVEFAERDNLETIKAQQAILALQAKRIQTREYLSAIILTASLLLLAIIGLLLKLNALKNRANQNLDLIVQTRTRELERKYRESVQVSNELELTMRRVFRAINKSSATLKGLCYVLEREQLTEAQWRAVAKISVITEKMASLCERYRSLLLSITNREQPSINMCKNGKVQLSTSR